MISDIALPFALPINYIVLTHLLSDATYNMINALISTGFLLYKRYPPEAMYLCVCLSAHVKWLLEHLTL